VAYNTPNWLIIKNFKINFRGNEFFIRLSFKFNTDTKLAYLLKSYLDEAVNQKEVWLK
jgi:hypothetical protein